ncbi:MAG: hypothetical protein ABFS18_07345 [Thermodesulfobacteriota bacterium]
MTDKVANKSKSFLLYQKQFSESREMMIEADLTYIVRLPLKGANDPAILAGVVA